MSLKPLYRRFRSEILQRAIRPSQIAYDVRRPIEVVGYFSTTAGVGESARLCADALAVAGRSVLLRDVSLGMADRQAVEWAGRAGATGTPGVRIWHLNPPMLPRAVFKTGIAAFRRSFNIGYWAWELECVPREWLNAMHSMNAIFVPSQFTRDAIAPFTRVPVIVVPHPVREKPAAEGMRARFGIADDAFLVSFVFSAGSSINRKNPMSVLKAFQQFARHVPTAALVMKGSGNPATDEGLRALFDLATGDARIRIVTDRLASSEITGLIRDSNAYMSLHRSEGFGLTVAEAILQHTPVVATGWSGTTDFCDPAATWTVDPDLVPVIDSHPEFASLKHAVWADPSPASAADCLRRIASAPEEAKRKAQAARRTLDRHLSENTYEMALAGLASGTTSSK